MAAPMADEKVPDPHFEHKLLTSGAVEPYCPAGHDVQAVAPVDVKVISLISLIVLILPAGQFWQVAILVASVAFEKVPDMRQNAIINNDRAQRCERMPRTRGMYGRESEHLRGIAGSRCCTWTWTD